METYSFKELDSGPYEVSCHTYEGEHQVNTWISNYFESRTKKIKLIRQEYKFVKGE
jgi:hypothetical protein